MINEIKNVSVKLENEFVDVNGIEFSAGEFDEAIILVNLTPHQLTISTKEVLVDSWLRPDGPDEIIGTSEIIIPASGVITRIQEEQSKTTERWLGQAIGIQKIAFTDILDLPEKQKGVVYIVSRIVAQHLGDRADVFCPGDLIRDENGRIVACKGLAHF